MEVYAYTLEARKILTSKVLMLIFLNLFNECSCKEKRHSFASPSPKKQQQQASVGDINFASQCKCVCNKHLVVIAF